MSIKNFLNKIAASKSRISKVFDDGGLLAFKDESGGKERGILIDTTICGNPECDCRQVHLRAIRLNEDVRQQLASPRGFSMSRLFDMKGQRPSPSGLLSATVDIEKGIIAVASGAPSTHQAPELLAQLSEKLQGPFLEILRRRYRRAKQSSPRDSREKILRWWKPGLLAGYWEVFPDEVDLLFESGGKSYWASDNYCITAGCRCQEIMVILYAREEPKLREVAAVFTIGSNLTIGKVEAMSIPMEDLRTIWGSFRRIEGLKKMLKTRRSEMKRVGRELAAGINNEASL